MSLTRRETVGPIAAALSGGGVLQAQEPGGVVDAHVHIWTSDTEKYPLAPGFRKEDLWYPSFSSEELLAHARPAGVRRINLVQMTWYGLDHTYILDVIAKDPRQFCGTGIVPAMTDVSGPGPDNTMVALSKGRIFAFRVRGNSTRPPLPDMPRWMDHPGYDKMFAAGAKHNLALSFLMGPADLPEVDRMCSRFPDTPVIIDHFCLIGRKGVFAEEEIQALSRMARHKRVMLKFGGFYALGAKQPPYLDMLPLIRRLVDAFGPHRCMWESDAPMQTKAPQTYEAAVAVIRDHADFLSASDRHQILTKTAEDFFFRR
jgi:predicted TIM-barrel fold metal-dependent hydrolase